MVGIKKYITSADEACITTIECLHKAGYDHISLYYHPHPKHTSTGLLPSQVLICAWKYKPISGNQLRKRKV